MAVAWVDSHHTATEDLTPCGSDKDPLCRPAAASLEKLVLAGCNCITEEQLKSAAGLFTSLHRLSIHHSFLLTESLAADVHAWAPESLTALSIDASAYCIERKGGLKVGVLLDQSPTKQPQQRRTSIEELQAYDERLRYSREDLESIAGGLQQSGAACAALSQAVQSLDLAAVK